MDQIQTSVKPTTFKHTELILAYFSGAGGGDTRPQVQGGRREIIA